MKHKQSGATESNLSKDGHFICMRCHQKCHLKSVMKDGKISEVKNFACIKGATIPDVMYHPDRVLYPLKRVGDRGEGKWERISWDQATTEIAQKLNDISEKYGSHTLFFVTGSGQKQIGWQVESLAKKFFDTPNIHGGRYTCIIPETVSDFCTVGEMLSYEYNPCYRDTNLMVFWGSNPDVTTPASMKDIRGALKKGKDDRGGSQAHSRGAESGRLAAHTPRNGYGPGFGLPECHH